jgi:hypothetical protein
MKKMLEAMRKISYDKGYNAAKEETAAILERLEVVYGLLREFPTLFCVADHLNLNCPDKDPNQSKCELCVVHYIKTGKIMEEEE